MSEVSKDNSLAMRQTKLPDVDDLLNTLGSPGRMQILSFACLCVNMWIVMTNHMSSVFYVAKTDYSCRVDSNALPVMTRSGEAKTDECFLQKKNSSGKTRCTEWTYNLPEGEETIISEFDLVCDDAYKSDLTTTVYFAGVMIGGIVFGLMADKYGRKRVVLLTLLSSGVVAVSTFILRNFTAFIVLRFFLGFFMQGVQNSSFILAMEMLSMKYRTHGGLTFNVLGVVGVLLLDFLAYVIKDWKYIQLCTGLLPFLQVLPLWFVPESLRWSIVQKNFIQAEAIIKRTVTFNKLSFPRTLFDEIKSDALKEKYVEYERKGNVIDVFKSAKLRKISFILILLWFTFSAGFYGLAFHISFLFGNKYLNFAISSILDTIVCSNLLWLVPRYGRRRPLIVGFFVCTVANAVCSVIASQSVSDPLKFLGTAMAIVGKAAIACCGVITYTFTSELYPTVVRNVSLGMNTFWTRVGGMAAPQIFFLGVYTSAFVPYAILTACSLACGLLTPLLPETRDKVLKDHMEVSMLSLSSCDLKDGLISQPDLDYKKTQYYETSI